MPFQKHDEDDYIANLLKIDAKDAAKKYELVGIDAFNPKRSRTGAPKPNTNFLRNIIRQTDNHNAALLAKEAEESRARLKLMNRGQGQDKVRSRVLEDRSRGTSNAPPMDDDDERRHKRRRRNYSDHDDPRDKRTDRREGDDSRDSRARRERDRGRERGKDESRQDDKKRRHRHHYSSDEDERRASRKKREGRSYRRRRSRSRSPSTHSKRDSKPSRHRYRSHSPKRRSRSPTRLINGRTTNAAGDAKRRSTSPASDSDPLEAIVGPLPPPPKGPPVRSRGRGAHKANSMEMNARFSSTYDPAVDVKVDSDVEDNFGDALEAYRDRQKWKQQGSDRLREAGFTDAQINQYKKGDEVSEEDVVWSMKGQKREWDRNKVMDENGNTELRAEYGRLT